MRTVPSSEPEANNCPSSDHATLVTARVWPLSVARNRPVAPYTRTLPSRQPTATVRPSGDHATLVTGSPCKERVASATPSLRTTCSVSATPTARRCPSGDQATLLAQQTPTTIVAPAIPWTCPRAADRCMARLPEIVRRRRRAERESVTLAAL